MLTLDRFREIYLRAMVRIHGDGANNTLEWAAE